jgi:Tfp pilus assembly protein FimT
VPNELPAVILVEFESLFVSTRWNCASRANRLARRLQIARAHARSSDTAKSQGGVHEACAEQRVVQQG